MIWKGKQIKARKRSQKDLTKWRSSLTWSGAKVKTYYSEVNVGCGNVDHKHKGVFFKKFNSKNIKIGIKVWGGILKWEMFLL